MTNKSMNLRLTKILLCVYGGFFFNFYQTVERIQTSDKISDQNPSSMIQEHYNEGPFQTVVNTMDEAQSEIAKQIFKENKKEYDEIKNSIHHKNTIYKHNEIPYFSINFNVNTQNYFLNNTELLTQAKENFSKTTEGKKIYCIMETNLPETENFIKINQQKKTESLQNGIISSNVAVDNYFHIESSSLKKTLYYNVSIMFNMLSTMSNSGYDRTFYVISFLETFFNSLLNNTHDVDRHNISKNLTKNKKYKIMLADKLYNFLMKFIEISNVQNEIKRIQHNDFLQEIEINKKNLNQDLNGSFSFKNMAKKIHGFLNQSVLIDEKKIEDPFLTKEYYKTVFSSFLEYLSTFAQELEENIQYNNDINCSNFKNLHPLQEKINKNINLFEDILKIILLEIFNIGDDQFHQAIIKHTKNVLKSLITTFFTTEMIHIEKFLEKSLFYNEVFIPKKQAKNFIVILNREYAEKKKNYQNLTFPILQSFLKHLEINYSFFAKEIINKNMKNIINNDYALNDNTINDSEIVKIIINKITKEKRIIEDLNICINKSWKKFVEHYFYKNGTEKLLSTSIQNIVNKYCALDYQLNILFKDSITETIHIDQTHTQIINKCEYKIADVKKNLFDIQFNKLEAVISDAISMPLSEFININNFFEQNLHKVSQQIGVKHDTNKTSLFYESLSEKSLKKFQTDLDIKIKKYYSTSELGILQRLSNDIAIEKSMTSIFNKTFFSQWIKDETIIKNAMNYWFNDTITPKYAEIIKNSFDEKFHNIIELINQSIDLLNFFINDKLASSHQYQGVNILKLYTMFRMIDMIDLLINDPSNFVEKYLNNSLKEKIAIELFFKEMVFQEIGIKSSFISQFNILKTTINLELNKITNFSNSFNYFALKKLHKNLKLNHKAIIENHLLYNINHTSKYLQIKFLKNNNTIKDFKIINPYLHIDNYNNEYNIINNKIWIFNKNALLLNLNVKNLIHFSQHFHKNADSIFNVFGIGIYRKYLNDIQNNRTITFQNHQLIITLLKEIFQYQWYKQHNETFNEFKMNLNQFENTLNQPTDTNSIQYSYNHLQFYLSKQSNIEKNYIYKKSSLSIKKDDGGANNFYSKNNILEDFYKVFTYIKTEILVNDSSNIKLFIDDLEKSQKDLYTFSLLNGFLTIDRFINGSPLQNFNMNPETFIEPTSQFKIQYTAYDYKNIINNFNNKIDTFKEKIDNINSIIIKYIYHIMKVDFNFSGNKDNSFDLYINTIEDTLNFLKSLQHMLLHFMLLNFNKLKSDTDEIEHLNSTENFIAIDNIFQNQSPENKFFLSHQIRALAQHVASYNIMKIKSLIKRKINEDIINRNIDIKLTETTVNKMFVLLNTITVYHDQITISLIQNILSYKDNVFRYNKYRLFANLFNETLINTITQLSISQSEEKSFIEKVLYSNISNNYYHILDVLKILFLNNNNYLLLNREQNIAIYKDNLEFISLQLRINYKDIKEAPAQQEEYELINKKDDIKKDDEKQSTILTEEQIKEKNEKNKKVYESLKQQIIRIFMNQRI